LTIIIIIIIIIESAESLVVAIKVIELEVTAEKTKYIVMSVYKNAGQSHSIQIDNCSFGKVENFEYLGQH